MDFIATDILTDSSVSRVVTWSDIMTRKAGDADTRAFRVQGREEMRRRAVSGMDYSHQSRLIPALLHASICSSGHIEACTSPMWALRKRNMQRRLWPMPPPME